MLTRSLPTNKNTNKKANEIDHELGPPAFALGGRLGQPLRLGAHGKQALFQTTDRAVQRVECGYLVLDSVALLVAWTFDQRFDFEEPLHQGGMDGSADVINASDHILLELLRLLVEDALLHLPQLLDGRFCL